ncbi:MAG: hypothetical protein ABIR66_05990 [Saprospiraceae bacterium]
MKKQFITDANGKNIAVLVPIKEYNKILEDQEELNCIRAYDKVKTKKNKQFVLATDMFKSIERKVIYRCKNLTSK